MSRSTCYVEENLDPRRQVPFPSLPVSSASMVGCTDLGIHTSKRDTAVIRAWKMGLSNWLNPLAKIVEFPCLAFCLTAAAVYIRKERPLTLFLPGGLSQLSIESFSVDWCSNTLNISPWRIHLPNLGPVLNILRGTSFEPITAKITADLTAIPFHINPLKISLDIIRYDQFKTPIYLIGNTWHLVIILPVI
jgi:hypothetical protein